MRCEELLEARTTKGLSWEVVSQHKIEGCCGVSLLALQLWHWTSAGVLSAKFSSKEKLRYFGPFRFIEDTVHPKYVDIWMSPLFSAFCVIAFTTLFGNMYFASTWRFFVRSFNIRSSLSTDAVLIWKEFLFFQWISLLKSFIFRVHLRCRNTRRLPSFVSVWEWGKITLCSFHKCNIMYIICIFIQCKRQKLQCIIEWAGLDVLLVKTLLR